VNLRFEQTALLWLALLALPLVVVGWRVLSAMDGLRRAVVLGLRTLLLLVLLVMLAGPHTLRRHDQLTVMGVLDVSRSVQQFAGNDVRIRGQVEPSPDVPSDDRGDASAAEPVPSSVVESLREWFRVATRSRHPDDRFGLIVFDGRAIAVSAPVRGEYVDDNLDVQLADGTNIAEAIRLALAMLPPDTARRLVLISDGNETIGEALEAARYAAGTSRSQPHSRIMQQTSVPIDVAPLRYRVDREVQVVRVESPPTAQPQQAVTVRIVLESTQATSGLLTLLHEGEAVDLNGDLPGSTRRIVAPEGQSVQLAQVMLGETPVHRFEAVFEAEDASADTVSENNRAESFTATPSKGTILVLDARAERGGSSALVDALRAADLEATLMSPALLETDLLSLQRYALIVLDNVAASHFSAQQHELLSRYVNNLGGGLIMAGGTDSFGAGGWNGTAVEQVLPLELDPPKELRLPTAALVLVLDKSGSMNHPVAGARATQQDVANEGAALAVESLRSESMVGVVTFDFGAHTLVPLQRNDDPRQIAEKIRSIQADGGTNLEPALWRAHEMLRDADVQNKRVVCLSDGRSQTTDLDHIARRMAIDNIKLTTIAVGDDADVETLQRLADVGGGEFYNVRNPRTLPRVLVDSVQALNKPLIKEVPFSPIVQPTGSELALDMRRSPMLGGLVITAPRPDARATIELTAPDGEPVLAHWQAGLGRVAAFTSGASGPWAQQWIGTSSYAAFWAQLARAMSRLPMNGEGELIAEIRDSRLSITYEQAGGENPGAGEYLNIDGVVYSPDGEATDVKLKQVAPGRYESSLAVEASGNYIIALSPRQGERRLPPVVGGASMATSPEFRSYRSNDALLEQIAQMTGGRVLDIREPLEADLFNRDHLPPTVSVQPAWRSLLWAALVLLLLDAASRRIAWDTATIRRMAASAMARVRPARIRGEEALATLSGLRQVAEQSESRQYSRREQQTIDASTSGPSDAREAVPPLAAADSTPTEEQADAERSREPAEPDRAAPPDSARVAAALDALLGRKRASEDGGVGGRRDESASQPEADGPARPSSASLLAARRRARGSKPEP
jgi:Mg-chelatase subunit ChlD